MTTQPTQQLQAGLIQSDLVIYPSRQGRRIVAYLDHREGDYCGRPFVIVTPKYGETKKNNLQLAYYLAANGLNVLRFDHTFHPGESDGEIVHFTFLSAIDDILASVDYLAGRFDVESVILVANSLSVRPAIRAARLDARIRRFISVVGVVNFQRTLRVVYQRDLVADHLGGVQHGVTDILGYEVDLIPFMDSCTREHLHDFEGTMSDLHGMRADSIFFYAENDIWVDSEEVRRLAAAERRICLRRIEGVMHELRENPEAAEHVLKEIVFACVHGRLATPAELSAIVIPAKKVFLQQKRLERERMREARPLRLSEREFWQHYLSKYDILENVGDYQGYLDLIGECLGPIHDGDILFDVGCGNGLFGIWCLRHLLARQSPSSLPPPIYIGLDLTAKGLGSALERHVATEERAWAGRSTLGLIYQQYDLERVETLRAGSGKDPLPFTDGTFDKICCSLLISYLQQPEALLAELRRVLKLGGSIVVSSMKPFCDLSLIYRDLVSEQKTDDELGRARDLLTAAGAIRLREEEGHYTFYFGQELAELIHRAGFREVQLFRSFGNQANVVSARR